jgi:hypothetical protein
MKISLLQNLGFNLFNYGTLTYNHRGTNRQFLCEVQPSLRNYFNVEGFPIKIYLNTDDCLNPSPL